MLGRTHVLSAVTGWVAGCATATAAGWPSDPTVIAVGGVVAAGCALLPDIDHPEATISTSLGPITGALAAGIGWLAGRTRGWTCRHCAAGPARGGHRAVTHTGLFAVLAGVVLSVAAWRWPAVGPVVVWLATALTGRAMLPRRRRRNLAVAGYATLVTALAATTAGPGWWWIGLPMAWGTLAHSLGDAATLSGSPLLWPIRVRGCRWTPVGTPRWLRFRTGRVGERRVWWALLAVCAGAGAYLLAAT
ncbi:metal-dependent hydrolase [Micromonospora sp. WMMD737]|uniref:metal-dependent hydrolase n=1 Tax=Micromonospora sp. WMMD737 TaxID=3404113 RepID=UPI003B943C2F